MRLTETSIHIAARRLLKSDGWRLLAGQYPGGSDDECSPLYIVDPAVARDNSPDPRRHSSNKQVPDIVAIRDTTVMIVEAKPGYSAEDREKLMALMTTRRGDLRVALGERLSMLGLHTQVGLTPMPCLAFAERSPAPWPDGDFAHILVESSRAARVRLPATRLAPL